MPTSPLIHSKSNIADIPAAHDKFSASVKFFNAISNEQTSEAHSKMVSEYVSAQYSSIFSGSYGASQAGSFSTQHSK